MKSNTFVYLIIMAVLVSSCSNCSEEPPAQKLKASSAKQGTQPLIWEQLELGTPEKTFVSRLGKLAEITEQEAKERIVCGSQHLANVIDPQFLKIRELKSPGAPLSFCTLPNANRSRSWPLSSVRAVFLAGKLVIINYRFKTSQLAELKASVEARYGKGEKRLLEPESILDKKPAEVTLWRVASTTIALENHSNDVSLEIQDSPKLLKLKPADEEGQEDKLGLSGDDLEVDLSDIKDPAN